MQQRTNPEQGEGQLQEKLSFLRRRLPLLERCTELASASLAELQRRLGALKKGFEAQPRRGVGPRLERLQQELGLLRRQIERLSAQVDADRTRPAAQTHGRR